MEVKQVGKAIAFLHHRRAAVQPAVDLPRLQSRDHFSLRPAKLRQQLQTKAVEAMEVSSAQTRASAICVAPCSASAGSILVIIAESARLLSVDRARKAGLRS